MKRVIFLLVMHLVVSLYSYSQDATYKGSFYLAGENSQNGHFYTNQLTVTVSGGEAVIVIKLKAGPRGDPGQYVSVSGTLHGTISSTSINATGTIHTGLMETDELGSHFKEKDVPGEISGTGEGNTLRGTLFVTYDGRREENMKFILHTEETAPVLVFPLGKSPKVFDKGWLFGSEFKIFNKDGEVEKDLSDQVKWSGTADFEPATGATSRPSFHTVGKNKIILTVEYERKTFKKEYPVITVDADQYARIGSIAQCHADAHGAPADPLPVIGPVITGNANVLINGKPAACEGDQGTHAACTGPNRFVISSRECDPEVLINGKKAARLNTVTLHCGGFGRLTRLESGDNMENGFQALSDDISLTDKKGNKIPLKSNPEESTKMITGPNGLLLMSPDRNTVMMILPNTQATISRNSGNDLGIFLEGGSVFVNGEKGENKRNLIIESFNEYLARKGTRFMYIRSGDTSKLIVYEGAVEVNLKKEHAVILVPAGKTYINDFITPYVIRDTTRFESSSVLAKIPKGEFHVKWNQIKGRNETGQSKNGDFPARVKQYWYVGAGIITLLLILFIMKKRKK